MLTRGVDERTPAGPTRRSHQCPSPTRRALSRYYFGLRLDELRAVHEATLPVGLER